MNSEQWLRSLLMMWLGAFILLLAYVYELGIGYEYEGKTIFNLLFNR